jgi:hypothetical protein
VIAGVDPAATPGLDQGADRDTRAKPCSLRSWCLLDQGHAGSCVEVPRGKHPAPDFMPKGSKR